MPDIDKALVDVVAGRLELGQKFETFVGEKHPAFKDLSPAQLEELKRRASAQAKILQPKQLKAV